jgi:capsular polysaccharide biosynthesis protein
MIQEREISLQSVVQVILSRGVRIIIFSLICMILGSIYSLLIPNRYVSTATLQMNKSKIGEKTMNNPAIPMTTYQLIVDVDEIYENVFGAFPQLRESPFTMKYTDDLRDRIVVYFPANTSLIYVNCTLEDHELAAKVANKFAELVIKKNKDLMNFEKEASRKQIQDELVDIRKEMNVYRGKYLEILQKNIKPIVIAKLNNQISTLSTLEQGLDTLDHSIIELQTKYNKFHEIFSATDTTFQQIIDLKRSIVIDPVFTKTLEEIEQREIPFSQLQDISFTDQALNLAYVDNYKEYIALQANLPSLIAKRESMKERIEKIRKEIDSLQIKLSEMDVEETIAKADLDRTLEVLSGIDKQVGWIGTTIATERQDLFLWAKAVPNEKKVYPQRSLIVMVVGTMAFLISFLFYLLADLYGLIKLQVRKTEQE